MGLFSKKKEEKKELPPLRFPNFPPQPEFPKYESEIHDEETGAIKSAVESGIPIRKQMFKFDEIERKPVTSHNMNGERRTFFVKVDKYKIVIKTIERIKEKIEEVEKTLNRLDEVKNEEDRELEKWQQDFRDLKENILSIDKTMFESE